MIYEGCRIGGNECGIPLVRWFEVHTCIGMIDKSFNMINYRINNSEMSEWPKIRTLKKIIAILGVIIGISVKIYWFVIGWRMYYSPYNDC